MSVEPRRSLPFFSVLLLLTSKTAPPAQSFVQPPSPPSPTSSPSPPSSPPPPPPPPPPSPPAAVRPPPPPPMQSRPAAERPSRLSLLPVVRDLDAAAAGQPGATPSGPVSQMEWDEEEETPPRSREKVRQRFREVFRRAARVVEERAARVAAEGVKETQREDIGVKVTRGRTASSQLDRAIKLRRSESVKIARAGIGKRRLREVSIPNLQALTPHLHFTAPQLASSR